MTSRDPKPSEFLPVEVIFNLLCVCRRDVLNSVRDLRRALLRRGLVYGNYHELPGMPFWIQICRRASLLDESWPPNPTLFASDWFSFPLEKQIRTLVQAWIVAPDSERHCRLRERLLSKLLAGEALSPTYHRELSGLKALGICEGEALSHLGRVVTGDGPIPPGYSSQPDLWYVSNDQLKVPFPPKWSLLWQLELYLAPRAPGLYPLNAKALPLPSRAGNMLSVIEADLAALLEKGLGEPASAELLEALIGPPVVRVLAGPVLEFRNPDELLKLRSKASLRKDLDRLISSRHVVLQPWQASEVFRRLVRAGLLKEQDLEVLAQASMPFVRTSTAEEGETHKTSFSSAERVYLLSLLLLAEGLKSPHAPPPGLLTKLAAGLDISLRAAAARFAKELLERLTPHPGWIHEEEPPAAPAQDVINFLNKAITRQESVDVMYYASRRANPTYRHLTPLLVEQRGPRFYLIAYCHTRRANRTFRLDRLRLIDGPPEA